MEKKILERIPCLFLISLIASYHEQQRTYGKPIDHNINSGKADYIIRISRKDLQRHFGFSIDLIWKCETYLIKKLRSYFSVKKISDKPFSRDRKWFKYKYSSSPWKYKYLNWLKEFSFSFKLEIDSWPYKMINIPSNVIYKNKFGLTYLERLSILFLFYLREKPDGIRITNSLLSKSSGISIRTIYNAKKKYLYRQR